VEAKSITLFDLNLILQIIIFVLFLIGVSCIKKSKPSIRKHRMFMGAAILLNLASIILIMGRSFLTHFGILSKEFHSFGPVVIWIHAVVGGTAEIMGIRFLYGHPRNIRLNMRITAILWTIALLLGITFYVLYYLIPH
jgi:uncharacterized membrane protein YozB (DUF420 family)